MKRVFFLSMISVLIWFACSSRQNDSETPENTVVEPEPEPIKIIPFSGFHGTQAGTIDLERWQMPESCSECHDEIYSEWQGTMHANAGRDPLFLGVVQHLRDNVQGELERNELRTCTRCHSGAGHLSAGAVDSFSDLSPLTDLDERGGTFCGFCHTVVNSRPRNGGYEVEPGPHSEDLGVIQGPHDDARDDGHLNNGNDLFRSAAFCGTCHDQLHVSSLVPILSTYSEWRSSPYNTGNPETAVVCQDCHMRQLPGVPSTAGTERPNRPGRSAPAIGDISPERPHIAVHHFVGANTLIPRVLADDVHGRMAEERLQAAATLSIEAPDRASKGQQITITTKITNSGAGHSIPTGMTGLRQMWLEITATRADGSKVFESGVVQESGELPEGTHLFNTVYGDGYGKQVHTFSRAAEVLSDERIGPQESATKTFQFSIPEGDGPIEVRARLRYRTVSPQIAQVVMEDLVTDIPITDMADARSTIAVGTSQPSAPETPESPETPEAAESSEAADAPAESSP